MPHRFVYSVTRLHGQAAIIHKTVELFDYLATSIVHTRSRVSFFYTDRNRRLVARYGSLQTHTYNPSKFANQVFIGYILNVCSLSIISLRSGFKTNPDRLIA